MKTGLLESDSEFFSSGPWTSHPRILWVANDCLTFPLPSLCTYLLWINLLLLACHSACLEVRERFCGADLSFQLSMSFGLKLRLPGLAGNRFTRQAILPASTHLF